VKPKIFDLFRNERIKVGHVFLQTNKKKNPPTGPKEEGGIPDSTGGKSQKQRKRGQHIIKQMGDRNGLDDGDRGEALISPSNLPIPTKNGKNKKKKSTNFIKIKTSQNCNDPPL